MFGDTDEPTPPLTYPPAKKGFNKALFLGGGNIRYKNSIGYKLNMLNDRSDDTILTSKRHKLRLPLDMNAAPNRSIQHQSNPGQFSVFLLAVFIKCSNSHVFFTPTGEEVSHIFDQHFCRSGDPH